MQVHTHQFDKADLRYMREALRLLAQHFIEMEASNVIEASHYERSDSRRNYRNGYRQRTWRTTLGEITLYIPKLRRGTFYPAFLDALRQAEPDLFKLAQAAYQQEVSLFEIMELSRRLRLSSDEPAQFAEVEEQLHDLAYRFRQQADRSENQKYASSPVVAISTFAVSDEQPSLGVSRQNAPQAILSSFTNMELTRTEWFNALIRVHEALAHPVDAVAKAA